MMSSAVKQIKRRKEMLREIKEGWKCCFICNIYVSGGYLKICTLCKTCMECSFHFWGVG